MWVWHKYSRQCMLQSLSKAAAHNMDWDYRYKTSDRWLQDVCCAFPFRFGISNVQPALLGPLFRVFCMPRLWIFLFDYSLLDPCFSLRKSLVWGTGLYWWYSHRFSNYWEHQQPSFFLCTDKMQNTTPLKNARDWSREYTVPVPFAMKAKNDTRPIQRRERF